MNVNPKNLKELDLHSVIIRVKNKPSNSISFDYLVALDSIEELINSKYINFDLIGIRNFLDYVTTLKYLKKLNRKNIGIELKFRDIRSQSSYDIGKWIKCIKDINRFCKLSDNQLIISSGAETIYETMSRYMFDSILKICDIEPYRYWKDLEKWVRSKSKVYQNVASQR